MNGFLRIISAAFFQMSGHIVQIIHKGDGEIIFSLLLHSIWEWLVYFGED